MAAQHGRVMTPTPTRELAIQVSEAFLRYSTHIRGFHVLPISGGQDYGGQLRQLKRGAHVIVGTPGRVMDHMRRGTLKLGGLQALVLDEADRMFDLGFIKDIRFLMRRCPEPTQRLSMLFSATLSYRVQELSYEHMNNPQHIKIESEQRTADKIDEWVFYPANNEKIPLLLGLFQKYQPARSIIFVNTKRAAEDICAWLTGNDIPPAVLSGDIPQKKRQCLLMQLPGW